MRRQSLRRAEGVASNRTLIRRFAPPTPARAPACARAFAGSRLSPLESPAHPKGRRQGLERRVRWLGSFGWVTRWCVNRLPAIAALVCTLAAVAYALLPSGAVAYLRNGYRWFGRPLDFLEALPDPLNLAHLLLFALLAVMLMLALPRDVGWRGRAFAFAALVGVGALVELLQLMVPGRRASLVDFFNDVVGAAIGCAMVVGMAFIGRAFARWRVAESEGQDPAGSAEPGPSTPP